MRALRPCMVITLTPSGPGTSICWSRDSGTSRKIFPPLRMTALSARPPFHKLRVSSTTQMPPSSSVSQSPVLICGRAAPMGSCQLTVAHQHLLLVFKVARKLLGEIHRAVLSAGAADGQGEVAAVVGDIAGQPALHKIADVAEHVLRGRGVFEKFDDCRIASGERAQVFVVMRVGQTAHIEYQIRVQRDAVLEAERLEQQRQASAIQVDELLDPGAQRIGVELGGVDMVADAADFGEQFALVGNTFGQRAHPSVSVCASRNRTRTAILFCISCSREGSTWTLRALRTSTLTAMFLKPAGRR